MIVRGSHNINVAQPRFGYRLLDIVVFITLFPTLTITTVFVFCFVFSSFDPLSDTQYILDPSISLLSLSPLPFHSSRP